MALPDSRSQHRTAEELMDATERLLIAQGHAGVSTRRISEEAGQPHGLVRYHFGTIEELMVRTLERASGRILERQRALYGTDRPFLDKWRTAMGLMDSDLEAGFPKLVGELFAQAWNQPAYRDGLRRTMEGFTDMLAAAVTDAADEYGTPLTRDQVVAVATLIRTFQIGMLVERLAGIDVGHTDLLALVDQWLGSLEGGSDHARPPA